MAFVFASQQTNLRYAVGASVNVQLPEATGGVGNITYSLQGNLPSGLQFSSSTRRITGNTQSQTSSIGLTYIARDSSSTPQQISQSFTIQVFTLSFQSTPQNYLFRAGAAVNVQLPAADFAIGTVTYAIVGTLPTGLSFSSSTRRITGNAPTISTVAQTFNVTYRATDSATTPQTISRNITITLRPLYAGAIFLLDGAIGSPQGMVIINGKFYMTAFNDSQMYVFNRDGTRDSNAEFNMFPINNLRGLTFAQNKIWGTDVFSNRVRVFNLNGIRDTSSEFNIDGGALGIAFANDKFYTTALIQGSERHRINSYNSDGTRNSSGDISLHDDNDHFEGLTSLDDYLFVLDDSDDRLFCYDFDGVRDVTQEIYLLAERAVLGIRNLSPASRAVAADSNQTTRGFYVVSDHLKAVFYYRIFQWSATQDDLEYEVNESIDLVLPVGHNGTGMITYTLSGLPPGITFNPATRVVSGSSSTSVARVELTYTATDSTPFGGRVITQTFNLAIKPIEFDIKYDMPNKTQREPFDVDIFIEPAITQNSAALQALLDLEGLGNLSNSDKNAILNVSHNMTPQGLNRSQFRVRVTPPNDLDNAGIALGLDTDTLQRVPQIAVELDQRTPLSNGQIPILATFGITGASGAITGFNASDIQITNGTVSNIADTAHPNVESFRVTLPSSGTGITTIQVIGFVNHRGVLTYAKSDILNIAYPLPIPFSVSLGAPVVNNSARTISFPVTFTESVTAFTTSQIRTSGDTSNVTGPTISGSGTSWTITYNINENSGGSIQVYVHGSFTAGSKIETLTSQTRIATFNTGVTATISGSTTRRSNNSQFFLRVTFGRAITPQSFSLSDITAENATLDIFQTESNSSYLFRVLTPASGSGNMTFSVTGMVTANGISVTPSSNTLTIPYGP